MEKDMEKDYDKRNADILGLTMIITFFIETFLLWFFVGGMSLPFAIGYVSGGATGIFIGWILIRGYMIRHLKEKRSKKNQAAVNEAK